ncbi:hypothetical protein ACQJBY_070884 [Aegilops geniculata]
MDSCDSSLITKALLLNFLSHLSSLGLLMTSCDSSLKTKLQVLVGVGFKGMKIMRVKNLNLYAFGLYMQPNSICEKLGPKYASVPTTNLKDDPDFYDDLLRYALD